MSLFTIDKADINFLIKKILNEFDEILEEDLSSLTTLRQDKYESGNNKN
jgi:hypothetical protein